MPYTYPYPRPAVTADCVVLRFNPDQLEVLLIRRGHPPFEGRWALPGGFLDMDETLLQAARRELEEETGLRLTLLEPLAVFDAPDRDPRGRVITLAHLALVRLDEQVAQAGSDASEAAWFPLGDLPELAFDHDQVLAAAQAALRERVVRRPFGRELLPAEFTASDLERLYTAVLGRPLAPAALEALLDLGHVVPGDEEAGPPPRLRFDPERYDRLAADGILLEL